MRFDVGEDDGARLRSHLRSVPLHGEGLDGAASRLGFLCVTAVEELDLYASTVVLVSGEEHETIVANSGPQGLQLQSLQFDLGEGPLRDVWEMRRPVLEGDMGRAAARWPGYAPAASGAGAGGVYSFPLEFGALRFGAMTLYSDRARHLTSHEVEQCLIFADIALAVLLETTAIAPSEVSSDEPAHAMPIRAEVYQAQSMVAVDLGVGLAEALVRMRAHAYAQEMGLNDLSKDIVEGRRRLLREDW